MAYGTIQKVEEKLFQLDEYNSFEGYVITTSKDAVKVGISNGQDCCENWGYLISEDDLSDMVGAELLDVKITDTGLNTLMKEKADDIYEGDIMFVDFITTQGTFQVACYNEHNGHYGHWAVVSSESFNEEMLL